MSAAAIARSGKLTIEAQGAPVRGEVDADEERNPERAAEEGTASELAVTTTAYVLRHALNMQSRRPMARKMPTTLEALTETEYQPSRKPSQAFLHPHEHT